VIPPMMLAALGIEPHAVTAGRICVDVFIGLTVLLGAWFTGQWIYRPLDLDKFHPGYFLPTAAGGLVASGAAATVGQHRLGEVMLGLGVVCWVILGSMILGRLFFRPMLPDPLVPTIAIEIAPPAVASIAWFALNGGRVDLLASLLAGYGALMALAQFRLLPAYLRLSFSIGFWAFTFSWSAVATSTLFWINIQRPPGHLVYTWVVVALITVLVGGIAARTAIALAQGKLLPPVAAPTGAGGANTATTGATTG
jgi:tellurite resistance protein